MRDRAAAIGATLAVESRRGRGAIVRLTMPLGATVMTSAG